MVKFVEVTPEDLEGDVGLGRGRVSYPILKNFIDADVFMVMVDREDMQQTASGLQSSLGAYVKKHLLPVKVFSRGNEVYLMRLDRDSAGNPIEGWQETLETVQTAAPSIGKIAIERK